MIKPISFGGIYKFQPKTKQQRQKCEELCNTINNAYDDSLASYKIREEELKSAFESMIMAIPDECDLYVKKYCNNNKIKYECTYE